MKGKTGINNTNRLMAYLLLIYQSKNTNITLTTKINTMRKSTKIILILSVVVLLPKLTFSQPTWQLLNSDYGYSNIVQFTDFLNGWQATPDGVFQTTNSGMDWMLKSLNTNEYQAMFFANNDTGWIAEDYKLYRTTNRGNNWLAQAINYPVGRQQVVHDEIYFINNQTGFVVTTYSRLSGQALKFNYMLSKTTNSGQNWIPIYESIDNVDQPIKFSSVKFFNETQGVGIQKRYNNSAGYPIEIMKTTNGGINWSKINSTLFPTLETGKACFFNENNMWILLLYSNSVYKSSDGGVNWEIQLSPSSATEFFRDVFFTSSDIGFVSTSKGKIYWTSNGGNLWDAQSVDTSKQLNYLYFLNQDTGWTGSGDYTLRTLNASTVNIDPISSEIPVSFALHQNYPNPFNPSTKIRFEIPGNEKQAKLTVYNSLGQEVAVLFDEELQPGVYEYSFDGSGYPSGVYFYRLEAGEFNETKRMVLVK